MTTKQTGVPSSASQVSLSRQLDANNEPTRGAVVAETPAQKAARDNRARQLNPNNDAYASSRGSSKA